jgi:hypothetical protein
VTVIIVIRRADASRWDVGRLAAHGDDDLALAEAGLDEWAAALDRKDRGIRPLTHEERAELDLAPDEALGRIEPITKSEESQGRPLQRATQAC